MTDPKMLKLFMAAKASRAPKSNPSDAPKPAPIDFTKLTRPIPPVVESEPAPAVPPKAPTAGAGVTIPATGLNFNRLMRRQDAPTVAEHGTAEVLPIAESQIPDELPSIGFDENEDPQGFDSRDELRDGLDDTVFNPESGMVEDIERLEVDRDGAELNSTRDILAGASVATLDPSQVAAVQGLARSQYGCLIGAAGTGKTTTTRHLLNALINGNEEYGIKPLRMSRVNLKKYFKAGREDLDEDREEYDSEEEEVLAAAGDEEIPGIVMCAFTGQATQVLRKNMPEAWKANCMTIHSMLAYAPVEFVNDQGKDSMRFEPTYTRFNKMPWKVYVMDESSMTNVDLWHQILAASLPDARFYFVGDLNQLPPVVGQGILGFALAKWPVFELTVVHRQKDEAANRIIDTAHSILKGKAFPFDNPNENPNWRVIGFELNHETAVAHQQVVQLAKVFSAKRVKPEVDPAEPVVYDPWRDRIMVPGNGFNEGATGADLGQYPLNESLSRIFADPNYPRIIIDAKKATKKFAVGYRVMATKNESPGVRNRVTNGLTGRIIDIQPNLDWLGDLRLVGPEEEVAANRKVMIEEALGNTAPTGGAHYNIDALDKAFDLESLEAQDKEDRQGGPCSHVVTVSYDNGTVREYSMNAGVEQLMIAYASTVHKAQGAEMPTAIIVIHHSNKSQLNRELLYTALTRASQRVIFLYTKFGLQLALAKQRISGSTLKQKIENYITLLGEGNGFVLKPMNVYLTYEQLEDSTYGID